MRRRRPCFALSVLTVIVLGCHDKHADTLLGGERGLDHLGVAVADLNATTHIYHDFLGFSHPQSGKLPNGIQNVNYYFSDSTYLETLTAWDADKAAWLSSFTAKHSGAVFLALSAFSRASTSEFLAKKQIELSQPFSGTIQTGNEQAMPEEKWQTFFLPQGFLPGNPLFFIAYTRGPRDEFLNQLKVPAVRGRLSHDNTAVGLCSVWLAVADLAAAVKAYASVGLEQVRTFSDPVLGANGVAFAAGQGELWLVEPNQTDGPTARFLRERGGPGIIGFTLWAANVTVAQKVLGQRTARQFALYDGQKGKSLRIPPELTEGVWMEFSQH